jgi:hypothetical protein
MLMAESRGVVTWVYQIPEGIAAVICHIANAIPNMGAIYDEPQSCIE